MRQKFDSVASEAGAACPATTCPAGLTMDAQRIAEDLVVLLRLRWVN